MIPLGKHWIGQCSLAAVRRLENMQLMAESGCKALFVGFESIDEETVRFTGKRQNRPSEYKETMEMLHEHGIAVWGSFVFGFDTDDPEVFDRTVEFAIEMKLTMAIFAILTPYPGTALYRRLDGRGAAHRPAWWLRETTTRTRRTSCRSRSPRAAARGLGARVDRFYSWNSMWQRCVPSARARAGSSARLLAAQRHAAPRHPGPRGARRRRVDACLTSRAAPR